MQGRKNWCRVLAAISGLAAIIGLGSPAVADPISYGVPSKLIAVPPTGANHQTGGAFTSFDISFFDPLTNADYVADRSNAAVDIFSGSTLSLIGRAPGFTGQAATTSVSGPDGVLVAKPGAVSQLWAGDGNSTLKSFDVSNPSNPTVLFPPIDTGGKKRVDEMAYSPQTNLVLVANNADNPAFGTLVNATNGNKVATNIVIPGATELEQPVWNPNTNSFFISVPSFGGGSDPGGVAEIKTDGTIGKLYKFASLGIGTCSPTGLALGGSGNLMVGCGKAGSQTVVLNPAGSGSIVTLLSRISGSDEIWYDPGTGNFYVTGVDAVNGRAFDVFSDTSFLLLDSVGLPNVSAHSIAVDPSNGNVFVPLAGTTTAGTNDWCAKGCVAVFAVVPEPPSLLLILTALLGLAGLGWLRRAAR